MNRLAPLVGAAIVLAAIAYVGYRVAWGGEERRVRAAVDEVARIATTPPREGDLPRLARIQRLREYLAEDLLVEVEGGPVLGGREAAMGILAQASAAAVVSVRFADVTVTLDAGERMAGVTATVEVEQAAARGGEPALDAREVEMTWTRPDRAWMLQRAKVVRTLE